MPRKQHPLFQNIKGKIISLNYQHSLKRKKRKKAPLLKYFKYQLTTPKRLSIGI